MQSNNIRITGAAQAHYDAEKHTVTVWPQGLTPVSGVRETVPAYASQQQIQQQAARIWQRYFA